MLIIAPGKEAYRETFSIFFKVKVCCVSHKNRFIEAILMSTCTYNIPFSGVVGWCDGAG